LILEEVHGNAGRYDLLSFYARRALRLGPALLIWLVLIAAPTAVATHESSTIVVSTLASLFYVGDFVIAAGGHVGSAYTHVWSLAIEEQFYAVWPVALVALAASNRNLRRVLLVGVAMSMAIAIVGIEEIKQNYFLPTGHIMALGIGCLAAQIFLFGAPAVESVITRPALGVLAFASLVLIICSYRPVSPAAGFAIQLFVAVAAAALILHLALAETTVLGRFMASPIPVWLGRRSYGLYLYHRTLTALVPALFVGLTLRYAGPLVLALSFVVAELSFRYAERPINRLGGHGCEPAAGAVSAKPNPICRSGWKPRRLKPCQHRGWTLRRTPPLVADAQLR